MKISPRSLSPPVFILSAMPPLKPQQCCLLYTRLVARSQSVSSGLSPGPPKVWTGHLAQLLGIGQSCLVLFPCQQLLAPTLGNPDTWGLGL